jgi:hypothetical protein
MPHFLLEGADFVRFIRRLQTFEIALKTCDPLSHVFVGLSLLLSQFERPRAVSAVNCFFSARRVSQRRLSFCGVALNARSFVLIAFCSSSAHLDSMVGR